MATFVPGQQVTLTSRPYGTSDTGELLNVSGSGGFVGDATDGKYGVYTIRLADGRLFRTEGILS